MTPDLHQQLLATMAAQAAHVEGVEVLVVGTDDQALAQAAAVVLAPMLHPGRSWGGVLTIDRTPDGWAVVVEDRGPARYANRTGILPPTTTQEVDR